MAELKTAKSLGAGDLDQRITLQVRASAPGGFGQNIGAWGDVATLWAKAMPKAGSEGPDAGRKAQRTETDFVIRWRAGVHPGMRVLWRGVPHDVSAVLDVDAARTWLVLEAASGLGDGR